MVLSLLPQPGENQSHHPGGDLGIWLRGSGQWDRRSSRTVPRMVLTASAGGRVKIYEDILDQFEQDDQKN